MRERGIDRWELGRISRAAADQRAGRAGRTGPGRCIRLWSERDQRGLPEFEQPEIHRVDLSATVLALHAWGVADPGSVRLVRPSEPGSLEQPPNGCWSCWADWPATRPGSRPWAKRCSSCRSIRGWPGCWSRQGNAAGLETARPSPRSCRKRTSGLATALATAAVDRSGRHTAGGCSDVLDRLDLLAEAESARFAPSLRSRGIDPAAARQVALLRDQLLGRDRRPEHATVPGPATEADDEEMLKWLLLAYPDRVVKRRGAERTGVMVGGRGVRLGPESVVRDAELYLALDAREDRRGGLLEIQVSLASMVRLEWLEELFPDQLRRERVTRYDESRRRVVCATRLWYHDLLLREDLDPSVDADEAGPRSGRGPSAPRRQACFEPIPRPPSGSRGWISSGRPCPN